MDSDDRTRAVGRRAFRTWCRSESTHVARRQFVWRRDVFADVGGCSDRVENFAELIEASLVDHFEFRSLAATTVDDDDAMLFRSGICSSGTGNEDDRGDRGYDDGDPMGVLAIEYMHTSASRSLQACYTGLA